MAPDVTGVSLKQIENMIEATADQRTAFDDLDKAYSKANDRLRENCATQMPLTPPARLGASLNRLTALRDAIGIVRAPLEKAYGGLSDEQQRKLDRAAAGRAGRVDQTNACSGQAPEFASVPREQIAQDISLDDQQRRKLDDLVSAAKEASQQAAKGCVATTTPSTIAGRLDAMDHRLGALITAAHTMQPAIGAFYAALSDEQKARFNQIEPRSQRSSSGGGK